MKRLARIKRHSSIRKHLAGTTKRPRLVVFRSNQHIYAQIIDDTKGTTLVAVSDIKAGKLPKSQKAYEAGKDLAKQAIKKHIQEVVFDRGGFLYHGRIAKLAAGAREGGLKF